MNQASRESSSVDVLRPNRFVARVVHRALLMGAAAALSFTSLQATAQTADTGESGELQEVIVTGSYIPRTDTETPSAVQVMSAEQIQQSGYTNISEILRNVTANGANTLSQSFGQAFAAGAAGVSLRGLTVGDTLVLIDGHRSVAYPLNDDNQRSFVDISAIPFNAIDQVQVLKDGASAIYGADAIGGVVNVILKKSYVGSEITAEAGTSEKNDGTIEHFAWIGGIGDLAADGWNGYLAVDFHHQDDILASHRHGLWTNLDWSGYGGVNTTPGAGNNPFSAIGNQLGSVTGILMYPAGTPGGLAGTVADYLPGCTAAQASANQCEYAANGLQLTPATEQINVLGKFTKTLSDNWTAVVQTSFFRSTADQVSGAFPGTYLSAGYSGGLTNPVFSQFNEVAQLVPNPPHVEQVPANYPGNTAGIPLDLFYNFHELGLPLLTTATNTYRLLGELNGKAAGWDLSASGGIMYSHMIYDLYGQIEWKQLQEALDGTLPGQTGPYIVGLNPTPGGASLFAPVEEATPTSSLTYVEAHAARQLLQLPGGPLSVAFGAQYFHKVQNESAPPNALSGAQSEPGGTIFVVGSQEDAAVFTEFDAQPWKPLELNAAIRYDHYDTYGSSVTPKFGVSFKPIDMLMVRGTWGKGFRAPSAAEGGASGELFGAGTYSDPVLCPNPANPQAAGNFPSQCTFEFTGFQVANPKLQAVKSTEYTGGIVFAPLKQFNVSVDYYNIKLTNDIISSFEVGGPASNTGLQRGPPQELPYCTTTGNCTSPALTPVGTVLFLQFPYVNAGSTNTSGFDVDLQSKWNLPWELGKLTANLNYTHEMTYQLLAFGTLYELAGTHGPSGISGDTGNPKDRAILTLGWDKGPMDVTATFNYTSQFDLTDPSSGVFTCQAGLGYGATSAFGPRFPAGGTVPTSFCHVEQFIDVDLYARYMVTDNLAIHGSVINVMNAPPPLDLQTYGGGGEMAYGTAFGGQTGAVGRFFTIGATYKF